MSLFSLSFSCRAIANSLKFFVTFLSFSKLFCRFFIVSADCSSCVRIPDSLSDALVASVTAFCECALISSISFFNDLFVSFEANNSVFLSESSVSSLFISTMLFFWSFFKLSMFFCFASFSASRLKI